MIEKHSSCSGVQRGDKRSIDGRQGFTRARERLQWHRYTGPVST